MECPAVALRHRRIDDRSLDGKRAGSMKILVIEDDREAAGYLETGFREAGHAVHLCADGEAGLILAENGGYDLLIVDRMLPGRDGLSLISALRAKGIDTPALILSALGQVDDRVTGLRAGGDDYLSKPYSFAELLARAEVLARRKNTLAPAITYQVGDLVLDRLSNTVHRAGHVVTLQPREFRLLEFLMARSNQVVTRTMLLEGVWDLHFDPQTNVIDVHVSRLRSKIERPGAKSLLHTVRGRGYMIRA
jgi:two-component system, OmpR family, response regulator